MKNNPLPRLDRAGKLRKELLRHCRLKPGEVWEDPLGRHRVGCLDAADGAQVASLLREESARLAVQDPPYNLAAFERRGVAEYVAWCQRWVELTVDSLAADAALYVWLGADQNDGFQPLADFMVMMRRIPEVKSRSFITLRNQRGYGTSHNWMAVRQELVYYTKGDPPFHVQYTGIPKVLRGYYKEVGGRRTANIERSKSEHIRASNVWVDVQQVFYRMEENVSGCYAQKPLEAIDRIVQASSSESELVIDFFAHSGTTLLSCERLGRRCFTADVDPVYCEIVIRRLERFREKGLLGWQNGHAFEGVLGDETAPAAKSNHRPRSRSARQPTLF